MAFIEGHAYVARNDDGDTFRTVVDSYDGSGLNEMEVLEVLDLKEHDHIHVYDPKFPANRGLWDAPIDSKMWHKYTDFLDQQAWEKGLDNE